MAVTLNGKQYRIYLLTFYGENKASPDGWQKRAERLHTSALEHGDIDHVISWDADKFLATDFAKKNADITSEARGFGYWLWKPYIIRDALQKIEANAFVLYHDIGRSKRNNLTRGYTLEQSIKPLCQWALEHDGLYPGVYMPHHGKHENWTKRDCFVLMNCDTTDIKKSAQIQATYSLWQNTPDNRVLASEWLHYCQDSRLLTDKSNEMGKDNSAFFQEHRHDQSIWTNICLKQGITAYGNQQQNPLLHRNLNFLISHARLDQYKATGKLIFNSLIQNKTSIYPRHLTRWLELYFCYRRLTKLNILLIGNHSIEVWKQYLPNANIYQANRADELRTEQEYDLIFANIENQPKQQFEWVIKGIPKLAEYGILICGAIPHKRSQQPDDMYRMKLRSPLSLINDFSRHKAITLPFLKKPFLDEINKKLLYCFTSSSRTNNSTYSVFISYERYEKAIA